MATTGVAELEAVDLAAAAEQYVTQGFVLVENLITEHEAAAFRTESHRLLTALGRQDDPTWGSARSVAGDQATRLMHLHDAQFYSAAFSRLLVDGFRTAHGWRNQAQVLRVRRRDHLEHGLSRRSPNMARSKVALVGGGNVGATSRPGGRVRELGDVVIFDVVEGLPQGKALDMAEGGARDRLRRQAHRLERLHGDAGADVVMVTAGLARRPGVAHSDLLSTNPGS